MRGQRLVPGQIRVAKKDKFYVSHNPSQLDLTVLPPGTVLVLIDETDNYYGWSVLTFVGHVYVHSGELMKYTKLL